MTQPNDRDRSNAGDWTDEPTDPDKKRRDQSKRALDDYLDAMYPIPGQPRERERIDQ